MKKKKLLLSLIAAAAVTCGVYVYANGTHADCAAVETGMPETVTEATQSPALPVKGKVLVAYFTSPETDGVDALSGASRVVAGGRLYGNTEYVATLISQLTGGDLFQIKTERTYPGTHKELIDAAKEEAEANARPKLATHIRNLQDYDVVFVGFPNRWYDMPMALYSFFEEYDFAGKTLIPFCTHGGSRFSQAEKTIASLEKEAKMQKGLAIPRDNAGQSEASVRNWLQRLGFGE